ncbi:MAG: hypothetical protein WA395_13350 [Nitrososphaeraceae archaeon]
MTRVSTAPKGHTISSSPETITKNGTALSPCSRALRHAASHACARALQCDESALALVSEIFAQHEIWLAEVPLIYCS